jgi:hypothetical protein
MISKQQHELFREAFVKCLDEYLEGLLLRKLPDFRISEKILSALIRINQDYCLPIISVDIKTLESGVWVIRINDLFDIQYIKKEI